MRTSVLTAVALALGATVAFSQSLAEIAAKEKERQEKEKKKAGGAAKVITEEDLRGRGAGTYSQPGATGGATTPGSPAASPSPGASPGAEKPKTEEEVRAEQEKAWHESLQKAQEDVTRLSGAIDRMQADLNDLTGNIYGSGRTGLLNRMDQAKKDLATAQQRVTDLQEEGRRNRYR
jgi:peptidoglycan hydrolase CwlO-like protein